MLQSSDASLNPITLTITVGEGLCARPETSTYAIAFAVTFAVTVRFPGRTRGSAPTVAVYVTSTCAVTVRYSGGHIHRAILIFARCPYSGCLVRINILNFSLRINKRIRVHPRSYPRQSAFHETAQTLPCFRKNISVLPPDLYTSFDKILSNVRHQSKHGLRPKQAWNWTEASMEVGLGAGHKNVYPPEVLFNVYRNSRAGPLRRPLQKSGACDRLL